MQRWLPLLAFVAIAALMAAGIALNGRRDPAALPSPLIGQAAPPLDLPLMGTGGARLDPAQLQGQPYLLNVWGSWCPNCRIEHPVLEALARSGRVRIVGFNYKDEPADAARWLQQFGNPYDPIVVDADGRAAIEWGIYGAPETFLVDAEGIIRYKHIGPLDPGTIEREILARLASP